ncbi:sigma-70 family RNA polymerase sigma factor [Pseudenhygromyxa sp. WMMC2535]|uniref:sigma-70 family RNA polymerase sigma factor n=1 Tax=Pseudenhygromyxa sp. WMMC2535 TaxID=2712867 RepID=UPI001556C874|nr:sigma-70 family RNA polymerase sigma factor [Pseudenhygromyxa sp. WMMC2535]NVB42623.1 sigma-70 family RNA polymerase sigma factor [Pseudenhygromyxa sp. WMMC2535]
MSAKDELASAQKLVTLRREAWRCLLDYPPFAGAIVEWLRVTDEELPEAEFVALEAAAVALRGRSRGKVRSDYDAAAVAVAEAMSRHRHESDLLRGLVESIEAIAASEEEAESSLCVRRPPKDSRVFEGYLRALRRSVSELSRARQRFVANNLRLVVSIAKRYRHPFLTHADLIQEGTLGLLRAVDGYDPTRGTRFSTYAAWWIKHGITRAVANTGLTIRVPANVLGLRSQLSRLETAFVAEHGRTPSDRELAQAAEAPVRTVRNARRSVLARGELPAEGANLPDETSVDVEALLDKPVVEREMLDLVDELPGIEGAVIRKRFALDGDPPMTLAEIGELHCLSRERIRQIEKKALVRMRGQMQEMI